MLPALFPLRRCVCGAVQGAGHKVQSSDWSLPFCTRAAWGCEEGQIYGQVLFLSGLSQGQSSCTKALGVVPTVVEIARAAQAGRAHL